MNWLKEEEMTVTADAEEFVSLQTEAEEWKGSQFQGGQLKPSLCWLGVTEKL